MDKQAITNWFDPDNEEHIKAYSHLQDEGMWPEKFIPDNIYFPVGWHISLMATLADKWVEFKIHELG